METNPLHGDAHRAVERILEVSERVDNTGDLTPFEELDPFAEDAAHMPPGRAPIEGRDAIMAHLRGVYDGTPRETHWEPTLEDVLVGDGLAVSYGRNRGEKPTDEGGTTHVTVDAVDVLERQAGGAWKVRFSIFNADR